MNPKTYPYFNADADLGIRAGDDWLQTLTFDDGAAPTPELYDFTDHAAVLQVRDSAGNLILQASTAAGTIVLGGALGTLSFIVPKADTDRVPGVYTYGLKITDADQKDVTWYTADFEIAKKVVY